METYSVSINIKDHNTEMNGQHIQNTDIKNQMYEIYLFNVLTKTMESKVLNLTTHSQREYLGCKHTRFAIPTDLISIFSLYVIPYTLIQRI